MTATFRLEGKDVLDVSVRRYNRTREAFTIKVGKEKTPPGQSTRTFVGYPTIFHALAVASQLTTVGLIIQFYRTGKSKTKMTGARGTDLIGRFHVFNSNQKKHSVQPNYDSILMEPRRLPFLSIRVANMVRPISTKSWIERQKRIKNDEDRVLMIRDFMSLESREINIMRSTDMAKIGVINYDPLLTRANGEGGIVELPCSNKKSALPDPTMSIGPKAFNTNTPITAMMTIIHEATHVLQAVRTIALVRLWRETDDKNFSYWLQKSWDNKEISFEDFQLAEEQCKGGNSTHQILAILEAFTFGYHNLSKAMLGKNGVIWHQLYLFNLYWTGIHRDIASSIISRLKYYINALDRDHQRALKDQLVVRKNRNERFAEALLEKL